MSMLGCLDAYKHTHTHTHTRALGNDDCHLILRGGSKGTNYDETSVTQAVAMLDQAKVNARVVVDCSHGNSNKLHTNQV